MTSVDTKSKTRKESATELEISCFDFIEFYVGNAKQASYYYERGFGFELVGYRGLETGERDFTSYALQQGGTRIILTSAMSADHEISEHVRKHGDGIKSIGLRVKDARACYETAIARGAKPAGDPVVYQGDDGTFISASIETYGDTIHTFIERGDYKATLMPGFEKRNRWTGGTGLTYVDHIVGNVDTGKMLEWSKFYEDVFGFHVFQQFDKDDISTQYSALVSRVMANKSGSIKLPINEPATGLKRSQIQEYLDYYQDAGVQHIAIGTSDIISTVAELQKRGIEFLTVPRTYYDSLPERVGEIDEDIEELARLGILVDREKEGYLLQIFTKPVEDRPTLFFEIIERKGASGFGKGNFMALFESIEREQERRGNL